LTNLVSIIGLGYVGLPLAVAVAKSGFEVVGIDSDEKKVSDINSGQSSIEDIEDFELSDLIKRGKFKAETSYSSVMHADIVVICVPTPLLQNHLPDLSFLTNVLNSIKGKLAAKSLLILESTVAPGTTRDFLAPLLGFDFEQPSNNFMVAYSPERIDPTNQKWRIKNTPKIVAGLTENSKIHASNFYSTFIDEVILCESVEIAETAKLLENSFRFINISFMNEISILCQKLEIDVREVIKAAATKPYGFMPFYPSIGVGGHCIPVDPLYLANRASEIGTSIRFIDLADQINREMPGYFVGRAEEKLGGLKDKKVLIVGVSYKPNVADVRETPASALINGLKEKGAQVYWHDDLVKEWNDEESVDLKPGFDLAIIATPHAYMDFTKLGDTPILDTRGST
jgi:UDP-N-acetyl-D-glucosamine dehydrogenase